MAADDEGKIKEALDRLKPAKKDKDRHRRRLDDYYKYAMPWRHQIDNTYDDKIVDEIFDSTAMDSCADFAADMLATLTPQHNEWIIPEPAQQLSQADRQMIQPQIEEFNETIFSEIRRSNFFSEALECYQDLSHGTMAMITQDIDMASPIHCESIPANDLLIARGPRKTMAVKGFEMNFTADQLPAMWPKALENADLMKIIKDTPTKEMRVMQMTWQDYSDRGNEKHQFRAFADDKFLLEEDVYTGQGSCPITVARWNTDSTTAWGLGVGYLKLPDIKTANLLVELLLERLDEAVDPTYSYEDDGVMNLENGIEPGAWIPRAPGSEPPQVLESRVNFDVAYFNREELRESIMRGYFQDKPLQRGKTPPTASQYLEDAADAARRLGAPAGRLAIEWLFQHYNRFAYILNKRGKLPKVELNGEIITLKANSPLIQEQAMADALALQRFAALLDSIIGPEMRQAVIDPVETALWLKQKLGVKAQVLADPKELKELIEGMKAQLKNAVGQGNQGAPPNVMG